MVVHGGKKGLFYAKIGYEESCSTQPPKQSYAEVELVQIMHRFKHKSNVVFSFGLVAITVTVLMLPFLLVELVASWVKLPEIRLGE